MTSQRAFERMTGWAAAVLLVGALATSAHAQTQDELFDDTRLHDIRLTVSERDWDALKAQADQDTYYPADLRWNGLTVRNVGIRSRGFGTRNATKPGLRVDFNRYLARQEFLGLKALVLDNLYTDASGLREVLSMKLFAKMGLPAPREAHARLFVNDQYAGLYVIVEPVDRTFVSRVFGSTEAAVEDGGFLYEYRWIREYGFEYLGPALESYAAILEPKTRETDSMFRLYRPIEELIRTSNETPTDRLERDLGQLLDLPSLVRFLAVQNVVAEVDGFVGSWGASNFYLYRFRDGRPARLIPWDEDHAFWEPTMPIGHRLDTNVLTRRVMEVPGLRRMYLEALVEGASLASQAVAGDARGWLEREIDRLAEKLAAAVATDPVTPFSFENFETDAEGLREISRTRSPYVLCEATSALDPDVPPPSCPTPTAITAVAGGERAQ